MLAGVARKMAGQMFTALDATSPACARPQPKAPQGGAAGAVEALDGSATERGRTAYRSYAGASGRLRGAGPSRASSPGPCSVRAVALAGVVSAG